MNKWHRPDTRRSRRILPSFLHSGSKNHQQRFVRRADDRSLCRHCMAQLKFFTQDPRIPAAVATHCHLSERALWDPAVAAMLPLQLTSELRIRHTYVEPGMQLPLGFLVGFMHKYADIAKQTREWVALPGTLGANKQRYDRNTSINLR